MSVKWILIGKRENILKTLRNKKLRKDNISVWGFLVSPNSDIIKALQKLKTAGFSKGDPFYLCSYNDKKYYCYCLGKVISDLKAIFNPKKEDYLWDNKNPYPIRFKFEILKEFSIPISIDASKIKLKSVYGRNSLFKIEKQIEKIIYIEKYLLNFRDFLPPFINKLINTAQWQDFEDYVFYLLKLLGIHTIFGYPKDKQKGQPDGVFSFKRLVVVYDATLDINFEESKRQQIENYCNMLLNESPIIDPKSGKKEITKKYKKKFVWIITRGETRLLREIEDVKVFEVSIRTLLNLYFKRLIENLDENEMEQILERIDQINPFVYHFDKLCLSKDYE